MMQRARQPIQNPSGDPFWKTNQCQMVPAIAASCLHLRTGNSPMHLTPTRLTKPIYIFDATM